MVLSSFLFGGGGEVVVDWFAVEVVVMTESKGISIGVVVVPEEVSGG